MHKKESDLNVMSSNIKNPACSENHTDMTMLHTNVVESTVWVLSDNCHIYYYKW